MKLKSLAVAFLALGLVFALGCTKEKGYKKVTGKVTMGGQALEGASVMFWPSSSELESGGGKTGADGSYSVTSSGSQKGDTGLLPGQYKVTVRKYAEIDDPDQKAFEAGEITYDELQERRAKGGSYKKAAATELLTPQKFAREDSTPLTVTVTDDPKQNVFDFNLDE